MPGHLLCLGYGFCARYLVADLAPLGWAATGSARDTERFGSIEESGANAVLFNEDTPLNDAVWQDVSHLLISAPPGPSGDPVLKHHKDQIKARKDQLNWIGYLSTTGVYGNRDGGWVD